MLQDLRLAVRTLMHARGFTLAAVATLAICIGANAVVYAVVDALLLKPLPFGDRGDRLVTLHSTHPTQAPDWDDSELSYPDLVDLRERTGALAAIEGVLSRNFTLSTAEDAERVLGASVTPGLFDLLGVLPQQGRSFRMDEGQAPGFESVAIISDGLWKRLYAADPAIVGRGVTVNERTLTIVGIMPGGFRFPEVHDIWVPYRMPGDEGRERRFLLAIGLLAPGASLEQARSQAGSVAAALASEHPLTNRDWGVHVMPLRDLFVKAGTRSSLVALLSAVALVLFVGCANIAGLLVARGLGRQRELTVRAALGAGRGRVLRLLLSEALVLAIAGGAAGLLLAAWGLDAIVASNPEPMADWIDMQIDGRVLAFVLALTGLTTIAAGLIPALRLSHVDVAGGLLHGGRTGSAPGDRRLQSGLVVVQVAMTFALMVGATLLAGSAIRLQYSDAGFEPAPLLSLRLYVAGDAYDDPRTRAAIVARSVDRVRSLPGVTAAAATGSIPGDDGGATITLWPERRTGAPGEALGVQRITTTPELWKTLGLALVEGRTFTPSENADPDADVVLVNQRLADRYWPGESALGRVLRPADGSNRSYRVIGVAPNVVYEEINEATEQSRLSVFAPYASVALRNVAMLVRTSERPSMVAAGVRQALRGVDPTFAAYDMMTMDDRRAMTQWGERFLGRTFAAFAGTALLLACLGIYGLTAYSASQRTREIGVRMAIGATPASIVRLFVRRGSRLALLGAVIGLPLAAGAAAAVENMLFRISPWQPALWAGLLATLGAAVLVASYVPARRAARTEPSVALRQE